MGIRRQAAKEVQGNLQGKSQLDRPFQRQRITGRLVLRNSGMIDTNGIRQLSLRQARTFPGHPQTLAKNFSEIHVVPLAFACDANYTSLKSCVTRKTIEEVLYPMNPIRRYRKAQGWTQDQLAQRIGRSFSYISHLEKGDYKPGRDVLLQLAALFRIEPSILLAELSVAENAPRGAAPEAK